MFSPSRLASPVGEKSSETPGFALIATLMMMVLLAVIALGMLSLSSISLRTSGRSNAQTEARTNARLALMLAIGELQRTAGSDTRVTAPADIFDDPNSSQATSPPLLGVWRSWEGEDHETSGFVARPLQPDYGSKKQAATSSGRFLTWLVSSATRTPDPAGASELASTAAGSGTVPLLSSGTLAGGDGREVHVKPSAVKDTGSYAWWISGENQKARIPEPEAQEADTISARAKIAQSHAVPDPAPYGLDALLDDPTPASKAASLRSVDLILGKEDNGFFHDLSVSSVGLLTNTATGGWRKDLTLLTENWDKQTLSSLPFFRLTPTEDTFATKPTIADPTPAGAMLFPWAEYASNAGSPIARTGAVSSWENLVDHATHYKRVSIAADGVTSTPLHSEHIFNAAKVFSYHQRVRVLPLIARIQWVFSHGAGSVAVAQGEEPLFEPRLHLTPVLTMWNPYNVQITSPTTLYFPIPITLPVAFRYTIDGVQNPGYNALTAAINNQPPLSATAQSQIDFRLAISTAFTLMPGETRVFSPQTTTPVKHTIGPRIDLKPGYRAGGGYYFTVKGPTGAELKLPATARIKADARFDTEDRYVSDQGVGVFIDMYRKTPADDQPHLAYRMYFTQQTANAVYPPISNMAEGTMGQCKDNPLPFLSTVFGARAASNTHLPAKGMVQSSPFVNYTIMRTSYYLGALHPVNSPFDYSFVKHAPGGDSLLPNSSDTTNRGYIVTGFTKADGLSRCVIAELPLQPLASLAELTQWDLRFDNPAPPYAFNLIGNSDAAPLIPSTSVYNSKHAADAKNLQYDTAYCANHLLFDDWFLSSIAPDSKLPGSKNRSQRDVYLDFLGGKETLTNRAYRAIAADAAADGSALFGEQVERFDSWKTIASRLEVEGMFNVNSTSVKAWRSLLGHARGQRVPHIRLAAGNWNVGLSAKSEHVLNRFSIAGDTEAGTPGSAGEFPEASGFAGYRTVDDKFLDALAEKVVTQIRRRGPFLSLSEFVNRQLTGNDLDLALAGTIQAALNELSKDPAMDPFKDLKALSTVSTGNPPNAASRDEEYQFRPAAEGHSAHGLPGWTRQADILRPLAPIISARDDTFTIRAYGAAKDTGGRVLAEVWCEATVRRTREYVDPSDPGDSFEAPGQTTNLLFGRRFEIISFRWLSPGEV